MNVAPQLLLVGAVAAVGVLHTVVPDHWVPITLIARQQGWSKRDVARAACIAGTGHTVSTLLIGLVVWIAGVAFATKFGNLVSTLSSVALIAFGGWIAISSLRGLRSGDHHGHSHGHRHGALSFGSGAADRDLHGTERLLLGTGPNLLEVSIFEATGSPYFRLTGHRGDRLWLQTRRSDGATQRFDFVERGEYWESLDEVAEPHAFRITVSAAHGDRVTSYEADFIEHDHVHDDGREHAYIYGALEPSGADALYVPSPAGTTVLANHAHLHRHGGSTVHAHVHDHGPDSWHQAGPENSSDPPLHDHRHRRPLRTTLLLILGSSPMVEGIPAFFAAGKYGAGLIAVMAAVFALSTIATYIVLSVTSVAGLQRVSLGPLERYGEVLSGAFIASVGLVFLFFPVL